jgi:hypothetical protein
MALRFRPYDPETHKFNRRPSGSTNAPLRVGKVGRPRSQTTPRLGLSSASLTATTPTKRTQYLQRLALCPHPRPMAIIKVLCNLYCLEQRLWTTHMRSPSLVDAGTQQRRGRHRRDDAASVGPNPSRPSAQKAQAALALFP